MLHRPPLMAVASPKNSSGVENKLTKGALKEVQTPRQTLGVSLRRVVEAIMERNNGV